MLTRSTNYLVEFTQAHVKEIFKNPLDYIG